MTSLKPTSLPRAGGLDPLRPPPTRSSLVADSIKSAILSSQLPPGAPLIERDLADRLGVSKTPVREALISLSTTGLVTVHPNRRMTVAVVTEGDIRNVHEIRLLLEPPAIAAGVEQWTPEDVTEASALLDQAERLQDADLWAEVSLVNRRFHRMLYARSGNELLIQALDQLQDRVAVMAVRNWERRATWTSEQREHRDILEAIANGDVDEVAVRTRAHISRFRSLTESLADTDSIED